MEIEPLPEPNPILWRERIVLERSTNFSRLFKIIYWVFGIIFILFFCAIFSLGATSSDGIFSRYFWNDIGYPFVALVIFAQTVVLFFFVPPLTAGAIANERKHETLDLLLTTTIPLSKIIDGKLWSTLPTIFRLVLWLALPLIFALPSRDITLVHLLLSQLVMVTEALFITVYTLYVSTYFINTTSVLGTVYGTLILYMIAISILIGLATDGFSDFEFLIGLSPPVTLVTSFFPDEFIIPPPISHAIFYGIISYGLYNQALSRLHRLANR